MNLGDVLKQSWAENEELRTLRDRCERQSKLIIQLRSQVEQLSGLPNPMKEQHRVISKGIIKRDEEIEKLGKQIHHLQLCLQDKNLKKKKDHPQKERKSKLLKAWYPDVFGQPNNL